MPTLTFQPQADFYYANGYWRDHDLWTDLSRRAREVPDKPALVIDDRVFSFDQLRRTAIGLSARLSEAGVSPGDVVVLVGLHSIEAAVAVLACVHRGVIAAPLPPMFNATQISALIAQTNATALLGFGDERQLTKCRQVADQVPVFLAVEPDLIDALAAENPLDDHVARSPNELSMVLHSSGTTSSPKGVGHSDNTLRYGTEALCKRWELSGEDTYLINCEFGFVGGLVFGYFPPLLKGGTGVLLDRWDADKALRLIAKHRCSYVLLMPPHCTDLLEMMPRDDLDLACIRVLAAPALTRERRQKMRASFGVPPLGDYGLSEVPGHAAHSLHETDEKILGTEGRPYDGTEITIVDGDERPVPPNTVGAVLVNGPSRFLGFLGNDALTRESLTDSGDYRTGDMGYLDEDGYFRFVARAKDIIRRGAVTIVPSEVTPVILDHPSVREVEIVPLPDERLGERACAAIIPVEGATPPTLDELREFLDQHGVAKYTWPESLEVFDEFPRTPASLRVIKATVVKQILERSQQRGRAVDPV